MVESLILAENQRPAVITDVVCQPLKRLKRVFKRLEDILVVRTFALLDLERR